MPALNKQIVLLKHDICELEVDVIVHSTNEQLNDANSPVALRILEIGGDELSTELINSSTWHKDIKYRTNRGLKQNKF